MMEKTIPNMHLKKRGKTEQMNKYQKYTGQSAGQTQTQDNAETFVRRRPRKTIQKIRPKSEVREREEEEVWIDRIRRRPLSYVEGTKEKDFYIQTCKKPVMFFTQIALYLILPLFQGSYFPTPPSSLWPGVASPGQIGVFIIKRFLKVKVFP